MFNYLYSKELIQSEIRFHRDLTAVQKVFANNLIPIIGYDIAKQLFLNTSTLIAVSKEMIEALRDRNPGWYSFYLRASVSS